MIDLSHIPETPGLRVFLPQGVDANSWQAWQKPRGFVMATIYAIGPGGGGGSGRADTNTSSNRSGGAGGGSGGLSRLTIPLFLIPDILHIRVTPGGSGGASVAPTVNGVAGNAAFAPQTTLVAVYPSTTTQYLLLQANPGFGGGAGNDQFFGSTGGSGGSASSTTSAPLGNLGYTLFISGNSGSNGAISAGTALSQAQFSQIYGGGGGGGTATNSVVPGGQILGLANTPFLESPGGPGNTVPGGNGFSWSNIFPLKIYGGTGGGFAGGNGGNGSAPGAGGGGGGGSTLVVSGKGGNGGPGCVIIQCW